ncbi:MULTISPECIES: hypothetical protein [Paenibacillus]|uniref:hypothetical protein n=1 Tax=Paenibacillus TaxID=44249 RepID=UPI0022B8D15B|nr:hypothetical protein [Paenibacillus caseinilyticus]MCZ8520684.1 hypothetical protein [Paenibacillus caseinilyticus]
MQRKHHMLLLAGVIALGSCVGLGTGSKATEWNHQKAVITGIEEAVASAQAQGREVRIKDYTPFEWDLLYIFPAYTSPDRINKQLGYEWTNEHLSVSDEQTILVFTRQGKVVEDYIYRGSAFAEDLYEKPLSPEQAVVRPAAR